MSNIGFESALSDTASRLLRAPVGDRYVLERMREGGYVLGGEQSGHVIDLRSNTTGDGPMTAMTLLRHRGRTSGEALHDLVSEVVVAPANSGQREDAAQRRAAVRRRARGHRRRPSAS